MAGRFAPRPAGTTVRAGRAAVPAGVPRQAAAPGRERTWTPEGPLDLRLVLGPLRRGPGDPTFRALPDGSVWRASRTPLGPATLRVTAQGGSVRGQAWGPGAEWLLERLPDLLGAADDPSAFRPRHRLLALTRHRRPGLRLTRTGLVLESLIPTVLEQKVTTVEAYAAWRTLVRRFGEPAPGPAPARMYVMPEPRTWALIPSWEWRRAGVDDKRASTVLRAVRVAARLEEAAAMSPAAARQRLEAVAGIGPWTSAETVQRSHGAPDEVTTGDLHLPGIVGYALAGNRHADDAEMLRLLEPYAGQRHRAARLILLSGQVPPRRAPRMPRGHVGRL
ncbi:MULTISPECIES: DNA-3-methyladenine glycosylase family protein [Streptomyces]|uniref:DNA-3-methyladenine glycosylase 2 family protein n=1 Tax=Streptomyces thermoviolaceus subsp. thermoviolaceus TaxID=66860 RepID=A0ABX0YXS9_STRTL|nr:MULTISPECIES: DNA-3-methyladenine glycosylase 2 family protein [Streptomyces]MCM3266776.1 DNA-3-methyladenine glycosylase 2 family protein [Streptomyces thermoviolaceus]NJP17426.1 DNA-3-methyladenine glycosylase 2 family protein [Streptomyces thermoviolaceus subsp. thermoviolaceus]RSS07330.1 DNA-3-methyladenine glycosylase 2 family protein [Streptomyces sp. WAC00469]WTD48967.1 DNA-3-methyladenine glycosylase 2 family protein [Streptomyces thermoviolaceus]GGV81897.1 3-methyladenine DNA glyco